MVDYSESDDEIQIDQPHSPTPRPQISLSVLTKKIDKVRPVFKHLTPSHLKSKIKDLVSLNKRSEEIPKPSIETSSLTIIENLSLSTPKNTHYLDITESLKDENQGRDKMNNGDVKSYSNLMNMNEDDIKMLKLHQNPQDYNDKYFESRKTRAKYGW